MPLKGKHIRIYWRMEIFLIWERMPHNPPLPHVGRNVSSIVVLAWVPVVEPSAPTAPPSLPGGLSPVQ